MNKNVLITGGSRGIGAAAVLAFAKAGYNVAFTYNAHPDAADAVRRQAEALAPGGCFLAIRADAGDSVQVQAAVEQAQREQRALVLRPQVKSIPLFTQNEDKIRAYYQHGCELVDQRWTEITAFLESRTLIQ